VYSAYFNVDKNDQELVRLVVEANEMRIKLSQEYLSTLESHEISNFRIDLNKTQGDSYMPLDLVVVIITTKRADVGIELGYLTQTTARVLSVLQDNQGRKTEFKSTQLFVCNVDYRPNEHVEALGVAAYVDYVTRFSEMQEQNSEQQLIDKFEKEKEDYVFCMGEAFKRRPRYIMIIEDDVLLDVNAILTVDHLLHVRINVPKPYVERTLSKWISLKLYYPERWSGYANEPDKILELIGLAFIGGSLSTFVHQSILWWLSFRKHPRWITSTVVFCIGALTLIAAAVLIGRQYLRFWRRFSVYTHRLVSAPDCCTQAVIYPVEVISDLKEYLQQITCDIEFAVDLAIDQFAKLHGLQRHLVEPNVARHIGFVSTVRRKDAADFL